MKQTTILITFIISLISFNSFAQKNELKQIADNMFEVTNNRNFDALMEMTYPKIFEMVPKEQMKSIFISMFEGTDDMKVDLPKQNPKYKISKVLRDDVSKTDFAFLTYDMTMSMTFLKESFDNSGKEMMIKAFSTQGMDAKFETDKKVNILAPNRMIVFLKNEISKNKWSMLNYDANSPMLAQILPEEVIERSKVYYQTVLLESKKKN